MKPPHTRLLVVDGQFVVVASMTLLPSNGIDELFYRPGGVSGLITHDPGLHWPDRRGESLLRATLKAGGAVALVFTSLHDALRCQTRLRGEVVA